MKALLCQGLHSPAQSHKMEINLHTPRLPATDNPEHGHTQDFQDSPKAQACQILCALHGTYSTSPCPTHCSAALVLHTFVTQQRRAAAWDPAHQREPVGLIHDTQPAAAGVHGPRQAEKPRGCAAAMDKHDFTGGSPFSKLTHTLSTCATQPQWMHTTLSASMSDRGQALPHHVNQSRDVSFQVLGKQTGQTHVAGVCPHLLNCPFATVSTEHRTQGVSPDQL